MLICWKFKWNSGSKFSINIFSHFQTSDVTSTKRQFRDEFTKAEHSNFHAFLPIRIRRPRLVPSVVDSCQKIAIKCADNLAQRREGDHLALGRRETCTVASRRNGRGRLLQQQWQQRTFVRRLVWWLSTRRWEPHFGQRWEPHYIGDSPLWFGQLYLRGAERRQSPRHWTRPNHRIRYTYTIRWISLWFLALIELMGPSSIDENDGD